MKCPPTEDKVLPHNVRTNPVGGWRTTPQAHDAPQVSLQCSHKQKAPSRKGAFDVKLLFRCFIRLHARFFFEGARKQHGSVNNSRQRQEFFV